MMKLNQVEINAFIENIEIDDSVTKQTGLTIPEFLDIVKNKPRDEWSKKVLQMVIAILEADDIQIFICGKDDINDY